MTARTQATIAYCWDADYPWDVRTEKICRALADAGFAVEIIARNAGWRIERETLPEGTVHRMRPWRALGRRLDRALGFPAFFNPRWMRLIGDTLDRTGARLVIVRDLPLAPTALWAARRRRVPVVLDMAENYAAMIQAMRDAGSAGTLDWLLRNPRAIAAVERYVVPRMDHILTVVEESSSRVERLGVDARRLSVVSNTPPRARALADVPTRADADPLRLVYLGLMEAPRGIGTVLEAVAQLVAEGRRVEVLLIGEGRDRPRFEARARELGLDASAVRFTGAVPNADALRMVATSHVGLVPHHAVETWNTTIPNKLFDYMATGLPVVTSDAIPAARIVRETASGIVFRSQDATDLAQGLRPLFDPARRTAYAAAGRRAILERYHWERDVDTLLAVLERLL